jgi:hypothetical protein
MSLTVDDFRLTVKPGTAKPRIELTYAILLLTNAAPPV